MAIVDERGRLFGRWNLLDLAALILLLGLIPLAYAAYLLFHDRPPTLVSVTPSQVEETQEFQLTITGTNLRPYMRVSLGAQQARDFVYKSTEEAALPFGHLAPGTYDVVLYDSAQERFRLHNALTVAPSNLPSTEVVVIGNFGNLDAAGAAKLVAGMTLPGVGQILAVGKAVPDLTDVFTGSRTVAVPMRDALRRPAIVKFTCRLRAQGGAPSCTTNDITIATTALLMLATPLGPTPFQVQRVQSTSPVEAQPVTIRITGHPSLLSKIKAGDVDTGGVANELAVLARVASVGPMRTLGEGVAQLDAKIVANLQRGDQGWLYDSLPLRVGSVILLRTADYEAQAVVSDLGVAR